MNIDFFMSLIVMLLTCVVFAKLIAADDNISFYWALTFPAIIFVYIFCMVWVISVLSSVLHAFFISLIILIMFMVMVKILTGLRYGGDDYKHPPIVLEDIVE